MSLSLNDLNKKQKTKAPKVQSKKSTVEVTHSERETIKPWKTTAKTPSKNSETLTEELLAERLPEWLEKATLHLEHGLERVDQIQSTAKALKGLAAEIAKTALGRKTS